MPAERERLLVARELLGRPDLALLGAGGEGVVVHDDRHVYKVFDGWPEQERIERSDALRCFVGRFVAARHFLPVLELLDRSGVPILVQPYTPSTPYQGRPEADLVDFLRECISEGVVYDCVNPSNFRFFDGRLKLVDYGSDLKRFTWKDWVYMARRAWITLQHGAEDRLKDRLRAALWDWEVPEVRGFDAFLDGVLNGASVPDVATPRQVAVAPGPTREASEATLLVKVCLQEGRTLLHQVRHLVRQLEGPSRFRERRVLLDPREDAFPRQYASPARREAAGGRERVLAVGTVDRVAIAPVDAVSVEAIHRRWFGLELDRPSTREGVPVAQQLWAFDEVPTRFVLQVDADAMVCRRDRAHDYLAEMVEALERHPDAVSVGFQVAHEEGYTAPYDAPPGRFCPEVRCGLIDLERLRRLRPLPNGDDGGHPALTWYRSVEQAQRLRSMRSLRGGDARSFYIHPMNDRKRDHLAWFDVLDQVEQGRVPPVQHDEVDLAGGAADWAPARRTEEHLFVVQVDEASRGAFGLLWGSLLAQERQDWGAIVLDTTFDPEVDRILSDHAERVTLVRNRVEEVGVPAVLRALRRVVDEEHAIVIPLRADDELLGSVALTMLRRRTVAGAMVLRSSVLVGGRLAGGLIAARLDALRPALVPDVPSGLLAGLEGCASVWTPGPWIRRGRPLESVPPGGAPDVRATSRPVPIGRIVPSLGECWVIFLRHGAKAPGSRFLDLEANRQRGLSRAGRDEALALAEAMDPGPDLVLSSPVVRARETAELLAGPGGARLLASTELLGGAFHDHTAWLDLKHSLGWEELVRRWIEGGVPDDIATPAREALPTLLDFVVREARASHARRIAVITQGYVNTGIFHLLHGRVDFSGGPLYGFVTTLDALEATR